MSKMKESSIKMIGEIPKEWKISRIKFEVSTIGSGTTPDSDNSLFYDEGIYNWIQSGDLYGVDYIVDTEKKITEHAVKSSKTLNYYKRDFIVLAMYGASVGNISVSKIDAYTNQACCVIKNNSENCMKYIYYYLKATRDDMLIKAMGGTQPNISQIIIKNLNYIKPILKEQELIADFLDDKIGKIDHILKDLNSQIEILNKYKKSLITEIVTKGENQNAQMKDSRIDWISEINSECSLIKLKYFSYMKGRIGWQGLNSEDFIDEGPYCVTGTDFINGKINWDTCYHVSEERYNMDKNIQLQIGDLLVTKDGTIGKLAKVTDLPDKACLNSHLLIIRPLKNMFTNEFLYYVMSSHIFSRYYTLVSNGSTMDSLSQEKAGNFVFPIFSIEVQKEITNHLDKKCKEIDELIADKKTQIEKMEKYKKSLIYEYVTGKKRVKGAEELYG